MEYTRIIEKFCVSLKLLFFTNKWNSKFNNVHIQCEYISNASVLNWIFLFFYANVIWNSFGSEALAI